MIKKLGHHLHARRDQQRYYFEHLRDQYQDRLCYYKARSLSRHKDQKTIVLIQDGMDQAKCSLPRSAVMRGKELHMFQKPKFHVSLTLVHGYLMLWSISNPDCQKDSNASVETLGHTMQLLKEEFGVHLPDFCLVVHADNTCREIKNNHCLRWAAAQVASKNLRSLSFRFLRCGHSHEDVDQCFGRLARRIAKTQLAQTPNDLIETTRACATTMFRPHEEKRFVCKMDDTRDWFLGFVL